MKKIILKYWWTQVILLAVLEILTAFLLLSTRVFWFNLVLVLCAIIFLTIIISWVYLIKDKKWWQFIVSLLTTVVISIAFVLISWFLILFYPQPDHFGESHPIPEGLGFYIPLDQNVSEDIIDTESYLHVWNGEQQGVYQYDLYYDALPAGEVFLKCYEATEDIPLSADRILQESRISVESTSEFTKIVSRQRFTIYEGDWGDYYAARIEVWHKDAETLQERKLCEKVYRVEGWMR